MFARSLTVAALSALLVTLGAGSSLASVGGTVGAANSVPTTELDPERTERSCPRPGTVAPP